jgi:hypothetical protein
MPPAAAADDEDRAVRDAADRLHAQLLAGTGVAQTQLNYDAEVDFGSRQIAFTQEGRPLAAYAKKLKLGDAAASARAFWKAFVEGPVASPEAATATAVAARARTSNAPLGRR